MRYIAALLLTVACVTAFVVEPPKPKTPKMTASLLVGTTVRVKWTIAATPSDSLTVAVSATGQPTTKRMYLADSKADSLDYPKPAPGASITVSLLGTNWRGTRSAAAPIVNGTYVEPDTLVTPPTVTQFQILPASVTLQSGQTQQLCVVYTLSDGRTGLVSNNDTIPSCQAAYQSWLSTHPV